MKEINPDQEKKNRIIYSHPEFKLYYKTIVVKTIWYGMKIDIWTITEQKQEPGSKPTFNEQLIYNKATKNMQWRKENLLNK